MGSFLSSSVPLKTLPTVELENLVMCAEDLNYYEDVKNPAEMMLKARVTRLSTSEPRASLPPQQAADAPRALIPGNRSVGFSPDCTGDAGGGAAPSNTG